MTPITPCFWFGGNADEAVDRYLTIFPNSTRTTGAKYGSDGPLEEGSTLVVNFELNGSPFMAINADDTFKATPAISFVVNCETQGEVDHYWDQLLDGGQAMQCGWLTDRFGITWQIVPTRLGELMSTSDGETAQRVMAAMLQMIKIDIAGLEAAASGSR